MSEDNNLFSGSSGAYVEELFARYTEDKNSVDVSWQDYFKDMGDDATALKNAGVTKPEASWARNDWPISAAGQDQDLISALDPGMPDIEKSIKKAKGKGASEKEIRSATLDSIRCLMMIRTYRVRGHLLADLDPLKLMEKQVHPELDPRSYGFEDGDMDREVFLDNVLGLESATVREVLSILRRTYCSTIGVEFMHINDPEEKSWIQRIFEKREETINFTPEGKKAILFKLTEAEGFENYLAKKYIGTKRFGLDGAEALIPALESIIKIGGQNGVKEIVIGMPHRGRLNVLTTVMAKPYRAIFHEFAGGTINPDDFEGSGDVKYHLGVSADREFDGNIVHLSLTANPSHLEAVNPVALGKTRAKLTQRNDKTGNSVLTLLMHGDAAFSGQGIVAECFALSGLKGFQTGGTIHVVVNNQIGFTTAPHYSRSSPYPSDMAKAIQAPVFHVNGDDPEAVTFVMKMATEYRQKFAKDVVVDMFCYRRFGHNEGDEPAFTQPLMYKVIRAQETTRRIYADRLIREGLMTEDDVEKMRTDFIQFLDDEMAASKEFSSDKGDWFDGKWKDMERTKKSDLRRGAETGYPLAGLMEIGKVLTTVPEGFMVHKTLKRTLAAKAKMFENGTGFDWGTAEALAYGAIIKDGHRVRLCGQDSQRGTFSHRHSVFIDQETEETYTPLCNIGDPDDHHADYEVIDSALSEEAVLGFEYGYSLAEPDALVIWEAQFGDFANGAQMIFDQFISTSESKWARMTGLVMLLPHGYEGQGPEHSSARLERFLQLCGEDNMQVANCTTPANFFHIMRRQLKRNFRKPLVIMSPKSLLRHKLATSELSEMSEGTEFHRVLWDNAQSHPETSIAINADKDIKRVIMCSGKVYYELLTERDKREQKDTYLMRVEQLYPYPDGPVEEMMKRFPNAETIVWCQEEPRNMGAWDFIGENIERSLINVGCKMTRPIYAGRKRSASPATGLMARHLVEQAALIDTALTVK